MARYGDLRASDQDREHVAERLRQAAAEGRLLAEELEQRLASALRARTYAELDPLVADLPGPRRSLAHRRGVSPVTVLAASALVVAAALAVVLVALMVFTGIFFAWGFWVLFAWWFFGRGRRAGMRHTSRSQMHCTHRRLL